MILLNEKTYTCPVDVTLGLIGGKWKLLILFHLHYFSKKSYGELKANLPGISEKMLSQQLKELERDKLIAKDQLSLKPYRVEYSLTSRGRSLGPLYEFISQWGIDYLKENDIDYIKDQHLYKEDHSGLDGPTFW
jgi:DNA-binding HxlR family transcriptional regulator